MFLGGVVLILFFGFLITIGINCYCIAILTDVCEKLFKALQVTPLQFDIRDRKKV